MWYLGNVSEEISSLRGQSCPRRSLFFSANISVTVMGNVLLTSTLNYRVKNPEKLPDTLDQICVMLPHAFLCIPVSYLDAVPAIRSGIFNH